MEINLHKPVSEIVTDDNVESIILETILEGFSDDSAGNLDVDPFVLDMVNATHPRNRINGVPSGTYVREANDYGQHFTYRFFHYDDAREYFDALASDLIAH